MGLCCARRMLEIFTDTIKINGNHHFANTHIFCSGSVCQKQNAYFPDGKGSPLGDCSEWGDVTAGEVEKQPFRKWPLCGDGAISRYLYGLCVGDPSSRAGSTSFLLWSQLASLPWALEVPAVQAYWSSPVSSFLSFHGAGPAEGGL